jgi:phosphatidylglycerol:prolipoprotein diacylglycerol transferase
VFPILHIGPLAIQAPGLITLIGIWVGLSLAERYVSLHKIEADDLNNLVFIVLIAGVVGGRLGYAALHISSFVNDPIGLISLNISLFDVWSGFAVGAISGFAYIQRKKIDLANMLDGLVPLLITVQISHSLANLSSGNGFGAPTDLPWRITLWGEARHPTQIYHMIASLIFLWIMWPGKRWGKKTTGGRKFLLWGALSSGTHLFLEAFHGDSGTTVAGLRTEQLVAWIILAFCLGGLKRLSQDKTNIKGPVTYSEIVSDGENQQKRW